MHRFATLISIVCSGLILTLSQCSSKINTPTSSAETEPMLIVDPPPPDSMEIAANLFTEYCSSCHGANAKVFADRSWSEGSDRASLINSIKYGIVENGMPAFDTTFTESEVNALADYIVQGIKDRESYKDITNPTPKYYQTLSHKLQVDTVATSADIPWGIKVDKNGTLYYTDRSGEFYIQEQGKSAVEIQNIPDVWEYGQGGLLDVALHPDFEQNNIIYLSYSKKQSGTSKGTTAVAMGTLQGDKLVNVKDIFVALPYVNTKYHFGSRIVFDNANYIYVSVGDRGKRDDHPQFLTNSCGKIHRLHLDGSIPEDNPFVNQEDAIQSIWSYGHRNPQGLIYDPAKDEIWENEHGPRGGDELNLIQKGQNFGWPLVSYGINYNGTVFTNETHREGFIDAKQTWVPSIAPSGMAQITGNNFPGWEGNILTGSLRFDYVSMDVVDANGSLISEERILEGIGRVRSIEMGQDGYLYVGVEEPGRILKVSVAN